MMDKPSPNGNETMVTVELADWRGKVDFHYGKVTRETKNGFYILEKGEEYYIDNSRVVGIYHEKESEND